MAQHETTKQGMRITDLRKVQNQGMTPEQATALITPTVVKSAAQMVAENMAEKQVGVHDYMQQVKRYIKEHYPEARLVYFAATKEVVNDDKDNTYSCGRISSSKKEADKMLTHIALGDEGAYYMLRNAYLDTVLNMPTKKLSQAEIPLRNAIIDLAHSLDLQCDAMKVERQKHEEDKPKDKLHKMGMDVKPADIEIHISELREEIVRLQRLVNPVTRIQLIKAEIKRLTRCGKFDMARDKQQELIDLEAELEQKKARDARKKEVLEMRRAALVKAREALAEKRKRKKQQEADRQRNQQPNFAKMAKKKMQKIKERQAERNQRKSAGNGGDKVKSCSMLSNVG